MRLYNLHDYLTTLGYEICSLQASRPYVYEDIEVIWKEGVKADDSIYEAMEDFIDPDA